MSSKKNKRTNTLKNGRRSKMLLVFLGISFLFWMLIKLSKEYTDVVQFNVNYSNLPEGKMLQKTPKKYLDITVKTHGFNLIKYHLNKRDVNVDLHTVKRKKGLIYYQLANELLPQIQQQVTSDVEVLLVQPDSLYYHLGISKTKKVLVVTDINIQYQSGYNLLGDLKVEPNFVSISGPEVIIDSITSIRTEATTLTNVNSSIEEKISIVTLEGNSRVSYSVDEVMVTGVVEKFTEAKLKLPFTIKNLPQNYNITTFPDQVEVIFKVGLSDYNKINKNDFKINCDYRRTVKDGLTYLIPEVVSKPSIISEIKIVPNQIEYLIKE
ncbi:MAG: YbbR-like domain-containing protein [Flavobacteriaceae bacterium]|nr:YbbR-like domain-containing protein [Flavobacteriaceae bacterium]